MYPLAVRSTCVAVLLLPILAAPAPAVPVTLSYQYVADYGHPLKGRFTLHGDTSDPWGPDRVFLAGHIGATTSLGTVSDFLPGKSVWVQYIAPAGIPSWLFPANQLTGAFTGSGWFHLSNEAGSTPFQVDVYFGKDSLLTSWVGTGIKAGQGIGGQGHWDIAVLVAGVAAAPTAAEGAEPSSMVLFFLGIGGLGLYPLPRPNPKGRPGIRVRFGRAGCRSWIELSSSGTWWPSRRWLIPTAKIANLLSRLAAATYSPAYGSYRVYLANEVIKRLGGRVVMPRRTRTTEEPAGIVC
jgi:hypothetical protein